MKIGYLYTLASELQVLKRVGEEDNPVIVRME